MHRGRKPKPAGDLAFIKGLIEAGALKTVIDRPPGVADFASPYEYSVHSGSRRHARDTRRRALFLTAAEIESDAGAGSSMIGRWYASRCTIALCCLAAGGCAAVRSSPTEAPSDVAEPPRAVAPAPRDRRADFCAGPFHARAYGAVTGAGSASSAGATRTSGAAVSRSSPQRRRRLPLPRPRPAPRRPPADRRPRLGRPRRPRHRPQRRLRLRRARPPASLRRRHVSHRAPRRVRLRRRRKPRQRRSISRPSSRDFARPRRSACSPRSRSRTSQMT